MNEQQLIKLLESAEGTIARLMLEVNRLSKEVELRELTEDEIKEVYDQYFDVENFGWLQLECIRAILQKASEK
jgi:hypothetical protein